MIHFVRLFRVLLFVQISAVPIASASRLHFVNGSDYLLILPRVVNANRPMSVYAACEYDDCRIVFLFQCFKYAPDGEAGGKLLDVYDLAVFKRGLLQNRSQLISLDLPNLERCLDLSQQFNRLAVEAHVQFVNRLNVFSQNVFKHRFDLTVSGFAHVAITPSLPVYKGGQTVRFFILPFNLNFKPFTQSLQVSLLLPNQLLARRWTPSYFANDQLNEFEYPLADRPLVGLYTIEVTILNQKFRRCFFVIDQHQHQQFHRQNEVELFVSFKFDHLLLSQNRFEGSIVIGRGREDANLENYLIKCSIFLLFKDFVDRQEVKIELTKFTIKQVTIENILELHLDYLLDAVDRSRLTEFLDPRRDPSRRVYLQVQADLHCKNAVCRLAGGKQTASGSLRIIPVSKYIYCPTEMQSNHSSLEFAVQVRCWLVRALDRAPTEDGSSESRSDENSGELVGTKPIDELIAVQCFVRTYAHVRAPFKSIRLRAITSGLVRFDLNLLEKFSKSDLKNVMSVEIELRLDNGFRERLVIHFKHQNLFRNLDDSAARNGANNPANNWANAGASNSGVRNGEDDEAFEGQFNLKLNRFEARINETATVYVESALPVKGGILLVALAGGQLLSVERMEGSKSRSIQIKESMFPYLELIACTQIGGRLLQSKVSLKIARRPPTLFNSKFSQMLTSFNRVDNSSKLRIKLWSVSDSFVHIRSIKGHLAQIEQHLALLSHLAELNSEPTVNEAGWFSSISHCFLVAEALDKCIDRFKLNEPESNRNGLTTAVDSLFFNQTKKPFFFDVRFFNESLPQLLEFVQARSLIESDFEENLTNQGTEHFNSRNATVSSYERSYAFSDGGSRSQLFYLDLIELDERHYEVKRIAFRSSGQNLLKAKLRINSRLYADEWANAQLEVRIDRTLLDSAGRIKVLLQSERDFKVSKTGDEFKEKAKARNTFRFLVQPLRTGRLELSMKVIYNGETVDLVQAVSVMSPGTVHSFFASRSFQLIENYANFFTIDMDQLVDPWTKRNLLSAEGRVVLVNDILGGNTADHGELDSKLGSELGNFGVDQPTGGYQVALRLAIGFRHFEIQTELEPANAKRSLQEFQLLFGQLFVYYDANGGYFVQQPGQAGSLYLTAFLLELFVQIKHNRLASTVCPFADRLRLQQTVRWIISEQTSQLFNRAENSQTRNSFEPFGRLTATSQVLISLCNYKFSEFNENRSDRNDHLLAQIDETVRNNTGIFAYVDLQRLANEFSSLLVYSLFRCRSEPLFKRFYFDLIRHYTKKLNTENYYISLKRVYTQKPFYPQSNHPGSNQARSNRNLIRPRSFDPSDTLVLLNTAVLLLLKLELGDYDESLDKFYSFINSHKLGPAEWTSDLCTSFALRALLLLRRFHYPNGSRMSENKQIHHEQVNHKPINYKQIQHKQIAGHNMTPIDRTEAVGPGRLTKATLELVNRGLSDLKSREFYFEYGRHRVAAVGISGRELAHYRQVLLNLNGIGHFKVDLTVSCRFRNLIIESVPHVRAYSHQVELKLDGDAFNLTLCQRYTLDATHSPLTIIEFQLPLQLMPVLNESNPPGRSAFLQPDGFGANPPEIDYSPSTHQLTIQLLNLNNTSNCFSIKLLDDMPFKNRTLGYYYSKIYDFNARERFNLSSGTVELPAEQQRSPKSLSNQNSIPSRLFHWFALLFAVLNALKLQCA